MLKKLSHMAIGTDAPLYAINDAARSSIIAS